MSTPGEPSVSFLRFQSSRSLREGGQLSVLDCDFMALLSKMDLRRVLPS